MSDDGGSSSSHSPSPEDDRGDVSPSDKPYVVHEDDAAEIAACGDDGGGSGGGRRPFCLQTAARTLGQSTFVYLEPNARGLTPEKYEGLLHKALKEQCAEAGTGSEVVELKEIYNRKGKNTVRCMCAAYTAGVDERTGEENPPRIKLAFRGTDTFGNVVADAKCRRVPHPPRRGGTMGGVVGPHGLGVPRVHNGFLEAWTGDGLKKNVLEFMEKHAVALRKKTDDEKSNRPHWPIVSVTGHSLGGAVAVLAAYDVATHLRSLDPNASLRLRLYTFGCPRVGNKSFAKDFDKVVPDCWNVIHDNDVVPAVPRSLVPASGIWKRHGRCVILYTDGRSVVDANRKVKREREAAVLKLGTSLASHETGGYRRAIRAFFVKEGLVDPKKSETKKDEEDMTPIEVVDERLEDLDKVITEARADPNRSKRILPGAT